MVEGYEEMTPLDPDEHPLMPVSWAGMLEGARDWLLATDEPMSFVNVIATPRSRS